MTGSLTLTERTRQRQCDHTDTLSTVNFGLERIVCHDCGAVTMRRESDGSPGTLFKVPHPISQA